MSRQSIRDYILRQQQRRLKANRTEKGRVFDEVGKGGEGVVGGYAVAQALNMKKSPYIVKWNRVRKSIPSRMSKLPGWNGNWATSNSSPNRVTMLPFE